MSTSSDNKTPSLKGDSSKQVIATDWKVFAAQVNESSRNDFAEWLDGELAKLESDLAQFVTAGSRYSGRR
ncbi:MAG: hypothetical protein KDB00_00360 [Planctomycetales bacterium]|nr:hypothetical protein [Planctomycetales bacterium]